MIDNQELSYMGISAEKINVKFCNNIVNANHSQILYVLGRGELDFYFKTIKINRTPFLELQTPADTVFERKGGDFFDLLIKKG